MVKPKLLDQVRDLIRLKHYSIRTEEAYLNWICLFPPTDKVFSETQRLGF